MAYIDLIGLQHRSLVEERERHRELEDLLPKDSKSLIVPELRVLVHLRPREPQTPVCEDIQDSFAA